MMGRGYRGREVSCVLGGKAIKREGMLKRRKRGSARGEGEVKREGRKRGS